MSWGWLVVMPPPSGALRPSCSDSTAHGLGRGLGSALASVLLSLAPHAFLAAAPLAALPLLTASAAQAQTQTLVGNTGEDRSSFGVLLLLGTKFTTGSVPATLTDVRLLVVTGNPNTVVAIRDGSGDNPGALVATLGNPSTFATGALNTFTAPANTVLAANTTYFLVLNDDLLNANDFARFGVTQSPGQTGVTGWSIADSSRGRLRGGEQWAESVFIPVFEIRTPDTDEAVRAWHIRFGRTVAQQVVDAVQGRLTAPPSSVGLHLTVAGEDLSGTTPLEENEGVLSKALGFESVSGQQLAQGSSFSFSPQIAAGQGPEQGETPRLAIWGGGALSSFRGTEHTLSLDGNVGTALLGADWRTERWQAGAALSHSWGNGSYTGEDDGHGDGKISSAVMTGLFPYGRYALSPRLGIWAVAGTGWGRLSVQPDDGSKREYQPGVNMVMGAVGLDGLLIDGGTAGLSLSTTTDLLNLKTSTTAVEGLASSEGNISRLRVGLEAIRPFPLPNDASLLPSLEVGIRHDGGDAESGFGLEVGAALAWHDPQRGISAQLKGRSLVTHVEEEFRQQGLAVSFAWEPDPSNRGPSLSMGHTVGAPTAGGMDALLSPTVLEGLNGPASNGQQFKAQLAYGFPFHHDRLTLTPAVALALSPTTSTTSLRWSLTPYSPHPSQTQPWQLSLEGTRQQTNSTTTSPTQYSLMLNTSLTF